MTKIMHDCPICGTLRTIRIETGRADVFSWSCFNCGQAYTVEYKQEIHTTTPAEPEVDKPEPKPKKKTAKYEPATPVLDKAKEKRGTPS